MNKTFTFYLLSNTGAPVRQLTVSRKIFWSAFLLVTLALCLAATGLYDYIQVREAFSNTQTLAAQNTSQSRTITDQRSQLQRFAKEIDTLKSQLVALNTFEKKIRIIANIEDTGENTGLFGMGGAAPDDLDPKIPLSEKHNSLIREMHHQTGQLNSASVEQANGFKSLLKYLETQVDLLAATPSIRPAGGWITSRFSHRISPFTGRREFHNALDIANRIRTPIIAPADGKVSFAGRRWLLGNVIEINHGHGFVTRYAHLEAFKKKEGDRVKRGETIALMGNTGRSTGPHVHYQIRLNGIPVNPEKYIIN
jgi:murein DD-endopeptidase MepM/ murein hydrolase activator NlpD